MNDEQLMQQALDLALRGRGEVEPNPRVGALALKNGEIVGRGWHRFYGSDHAEVEALSDARENGAKPDTLVVTLEPCSTALGQDGKKTPPCTAAILESGVEQVIVGATDPDPRHAGKGIAALQAKVDTTHGVLAAKCLAINRPFTRWLALDRPWTLAKYAMTLDGKTAAPTGEARWISGPESRKKVHELRSRLDAVVVGFRTATIDDPQLTVRHVEGSQPIRIVVDPLAEIDNDSHLVSTAPEIPTWLLASADADPRRTGPLRDRGVTVIHVETERDPRRLQFRQAWRELRSRAVRRLMVEGGGKLLAQLLSSDCVDQILAFIAPKIIGGESAPTPVAGEGQPDMDRAWQLEEMHSFPCGEDLAVGGFLTRTNDGAKSPA